MTRPWIRTVTAAAALAWSVAASAATLQTLDLPTDPEHPHFDLHPYIGYDEAYDSNILLLPQAQSSWIHTANAGLRMPVALGDRSRLLLNYDGAYRNYSYSNNASFKNAFIQGVDARYWFTGNRGLRLRAKESYLNTIDPASSELTQLLRRWTNIAGVEAGYEPDERPVHLTVDAQEIRNKYVSDVPALRPSLDRYEQLAGVKLGWQLQPKTVAYAAYHRDILHFTDAPSPSRDSKGHLIDFGVEGALATTLSGRVQAGMVYRRYDAPLGPGQGNTTRNMTALTSLLWQPLERSRAELAFHRSLEESSYDINQFYIATSATLALQHTFMWDLTARVNGLIGWDKYPTTTVIGPLSVNRRDDNYQGGASLDYPLRPWLKGGASYLYRARFSRGLSGQFDFRDHITTLSLTATY